MHLSKYLVKAIKIIEQGKPKDNRTQGRLYKQALKAVKFRNMYPVNFVKSYFRVKTST